MVIRGMSCLLAGLWLSACVQAGDRLDFNRHIRPILADHCFSCHGADEATRKAGLRLDLGTEALKPAKSGMVALVPGEPDSSELIDRICADEPELVMPPPGEGNHPLSDAQKATLRQWVSEGASYQQHWAFIPATRPGTPRVNDPAWPRNPIDAFVLAKLESQGLRPTLEANRHTLIRRLSLDLTGLPPTVEEINGFIQDDSSNAYEKVVDRLLASQQYGEQMAATWLDFARYADSNGYQVDSSRDMSAWRDWVIQAFNRNMPFDQFTVEQLAGDLLPTPTRDQLIATGFNRNHRLTGEGGSIAEEWRVETVIDRVETTGQTWLGLTLNCARCHDHKYDPITQKEFYQFFAFFNNVPETGMIGEEAKNTEPTIQTPSLAQEQELSRLEQVARDAAVALKEQEQQLPKLLEAWEPEFRKQVESLGDPWIPLSPKVVASEGGATFTKQEDGSWLAGGTNPARDVYTISAPIAAGPISGLLLEAFPDPSLPNQSLGRYPNGNYVLTGVEAELLAPGIESPVKGRFVTADADYSQPNYEAKFLVDDDPRNGWAISGNDADKRVKRSLVLVLDSPLAAPADAVLTVRLKHEAIDQHNIGRFRLSVTRRPRELVKLDSAAGLSTILPIVQLPPDQRTQAQRDQLTAYFRKEVDSPLRQAEQKLQAVQKAEQTYRAALPNTMVMRELPQPREAFFLIRGQYDRRGEPVTAALPASLPALPAGQPMNRLGLARWLVDPANPLTARVWVNRAWERFFGVGLSKTTENLGTQAEFPSNPELLDWLATEFVRLGWDMKALQKAIVMSATYRQSSTLSQELVELDPENRLLARGPRFRLSGEMVRDQALAASGLLVRKVGGSSVRPYMPDGVWDETSKYGNLRNYQADKGEGLYRRTLYTIWKRTAAPPTLLLFDSPSRETCTIKRSRTNTPLQALALLNEVTFVEAARKLAERMLTEGGNTPESRIKHGFLLATSRPPTDEELQVLLQGLARDLERFHHDPASAQKLLASGQSPAQADLPTPELAAYTMTANILLNLDETITRE